MIRTAVLLEPEARIARLLCPMLSPEKSRLRLPRPGEKLCCSLLIVSPEWTRPAPDTRCRILLTPSDRSSLLRTVRADYAVSFGVSQKASISFSSRTENALTLSIRREIPTLWGQRLEMQEIPMHCAAAGTEEMLCACAARLLMEGIPEA